MTQHDNLSITGRIDTKAYTDEQLPENFDDLSEEEQVNTLKEREPAVSETSHNVTVREMHEYIAQNLDESQAVNKDVTHLAVGDDSASGTSVSDSALNNEVFRKEVSSYSQTSNELVSSTVIQESEANGNTFREVGLFAGSDATFTMWNHATISDITKDNTRTITIDVTFTFDTA